MENSCLSLVIGRIKIALKTYTRDRCVTTSYYYWRVAHGGRAFILRITNDALRDASLVIEASFAFTSARVISKLKCRTFPDPKEDIIL